MVTQTETRAIKASENKSSKTFQRKLTALYTPATLEVCTNAELSVMAKSCIAQACVRINVPHRYSTCCANRPARA